MDLEKDWYVSQIWQWDGSGAAPFTAGKADKSPRWSPDGSQLAFLRAPEPSTPFQVAVMPTDGGEPRVISDFALGVTELEWSPDGRSLAVVAKTWSDEYAELDEAERERKPRRLARLPFRWDNMGWTHDRRNHVWLIDPGGSEAARCLTPGEFNEGGIVWSPDGAAVGFLSARHPEYGLEAGVQAFTVAISGGEAVTRSEVAAWENLSFDHSGQLYATGLPDRWGYPATLGVHRLDPEGPVELTAGFDRNLAVPTPPTAPTGPQWLADGSARVLIEDQGKVTVGVLGADGAVSEIIGGNRAITGASFAADGEAAILVASTTTNPGELFWWDGTDETQLTDLNGALESEMVAPTRFTIEHEGISVEGWVYLPPGSGEVPVLLNIHGGPATQYGWGFFDEFQVYVGAGYGVVATNPRGSSGYGRDHVRAVLGEWQSDDPPDMRDLLAAVDAAAAVESRLDVDNVGVMGGSYGGLATVRLIAIDQRFKSAVAERGLYVFNSFAGTSDIGPWFTRLYLADDVLDSAATMWDASPLNGFANITTPTLIVHSEDDFRCPIEQAEQLFVAMLRNGTPVELLRFPSPASHELSRSGKPRHRVDRFEAIIEWHDRNLK
jgi:dipeptidyl aminopeptidase/acylaminoacyl peptidase